MILELTKPSRKDRNKKGLVTAVGVLFIIAGIALGIYVGLFVLFIGGIVDVVDGLNATPADGNLIAWGIVKSVLLAEGTGALIFFFLALIGMLCFDWEPKRKSKRNSL